jgi:hypothetical protein
MEQSRQFAGYKEVNIVPKDSYFWSCEALYRYWSNCKYDKIEYVPHTNYKCISSEKTLADITEAEMNKFWDSIRNSEQCERKWQTHSSAIKKVGEEGT